MVSGRVLRTALALFLAANPYIEDGPVPDAGDFFTIPFEVPAGTAEIEVRHDDLSSSNILDWGLLQPDGGFRGWGGGNSEPAIVGATSSSRSYLTGPMPEGTWRVLVGKAFVPQLPAKYRVEIETRNTATLAAQPRSPYVAAAPLSTERRWYAGDLHVHSIQSGDARPTLDEIATVAESRGLDFVAISDHNTVAQLDYFNDAQPRHPSMLLVPSVEFTTYNGHLGGFGATRFVPFSMGFEGVTLDGALADFASQSAVPVINHPTLDLGTFCVGCAWKHPLPGGFRGAIEVGVGGYDETGVLFDPAAIAWWEALADRGVHLAAVGGSDDHKAGVGANQTQSQIGSPTTLIHSEGLSAAALSKALSEGRSVVKLRGPGDPMLKLSAPAVLELERKADQLVASSAVITAEVSGAAGMTLAWIENGNLAREVKIESDTFSARFELVAPEGQSVRLRAEVRESGTPRTLSSHVWLAAEFPPPPPVQSTVGKAPGCLGCGSAGGSGVLALALLALRLGRRPRSGRTARGPDAGHPERAPFPVHPERAQRVEGSAE